MLANPALFIGYKLVFVLHPHAPFFSFSCSARYATKTVKVDSDSRLAIGRGEGVKSKGGKINYIFDLFLEMKIGAIIANNKITLVIINKNAPVV